MKTGVSINFTPGATGEASRWLRLEQVQEEPQTATLADAARLIDTLFETDPCVQGSEGSGGQASSEKDIPDEEEFLAAAQATVLGDLCKEDDHWTAQVDVFRSHQSPGYRLISETALIGASKVMHQTRIERKDLDKAASLDLEYPYYRGISVSGAEVARVQGSTVIFAQLVTGAVTISYKSVWTRVFVHVPLVADDKGQIKAEAAAVACFWAELAAGCELTRPEEDDGLDAMEREKMCRKGGSTGHLGGDCWKTIEHYARCQCSGTEAPGRGWRETVAVSCPKGVAPGAHLGTARKLDGYVWCEGEKDEKLSDPEYFKKRCCKPPHRPLPICRKTYANYSGGEEISGGPQSYIDVYGPGTVLTAVSPKEGCGELVHEWNVPQKNCCNDITPLSPSPGNPEEFHAGESHEICVLDGKPGELKWTASGGLYFLDGDRKTQRIITESRCQRVYAEREGLCPTPSIRVDDGCKPLQMVFQGGGATPPRIPPGDRVCAPGGTLTVTATGGVLPYQWASDQLRLLASSGTGAMFRAPADFCGMATVTVSDACTQTASCGVRSPRGRWRPAAGHNQVRCTLPFSGVFTQTGATIGELQGDGYRISIFLGHTYPCTETPLCPGDNVLAAELDNQDYCQHQLGIQNEYWQSEYRGGGSCYTVPLDSPANAWCVGIVHQYAMWLEEWVCD